VSNYRLTRPRQSLRRSTVHLDNVALIPASLLPFKTPWQRIANDLPPGEILIVLPGQARQQAVARFVAAQLEANGTHVRVINKERPANTLLAASRRLQ